MRREPCSIVGQTEDRNEPVDPEIEVRVWMKRNRIRSIDVARKLGINPSAIVNWLQGRIASRNIADYFVSKGCPRELVEQLRRWK